MKNFTIVLTVLFALTIKANAQVPNSGFENWTTVGNYEDPTGWATSNSYSTGSFYPVTKSTDHYPITLGAYSVRIESNPSLLPNYSGLGIIMPGTFAAPHPTFKIIGHPNSLTGYFKFFPQNGDTMEISVHLYLNGNDVSWGNIFSTSSTVSSWTSFNIPFNSYATADSGTIMLQAYYKNAGNAVPHGNSVLYIDNLNFDNLISSVSEQISKNIVFSLFPNPASDIVTLNIENKNFKDLTLKIYNMMGELVRSELLRQNLQKINLGGLNNGIYTVEINSLEWSGIQKLIIQR